MKFSDIPQYTKSASYEVDIPWWSLLETIDRYLEYGLNLDPVFQRAHVWTPVQQSRYVEYILKGGKSSRLIYFNHPGWMKSFKGNFDLVDGKQRLQAVRKFLNNELAIFDGHFLNDFEDRFHSDASFRFAINDLEKPNDILQWYIDLNYGGTPHTDEELDRVKKLLEIANGN